MSFTYEDRPSDSTYVKTIWRTTTEQDGTYIAAADGSWDILIDQREGSTYIQLCGPSTKAAPVHYLAGSTCLGIRFQIGTFMPNLPTDRLLNNATALPQVSKKTFRLDGLVWEMPTFENVETFVARLVRQGVLTRDNMVDTLLQDRQPDLSLRSIQRRFIHATGLTQVAVRQIERAQYAAALLQQGHSIVETAFLAGYTDQPHMTKSLKQLLGQTPAQIARNHR